MPELNHLSYEGLIQFVRIDLTAWGRGVRRFTDTSTYLSDLPETSSVTWSGQTWLPVPFQSGGFQRGGENLARPAFQIGDFSGELYAMMRAIGFAPGAPVTRYQALKADVIANNPFGVILEERYVLNSVRKQGIALELELAHPIDFASRKVPALIMTREEYPGLGSTILR